MSAFHVPDHLILPYGRAVKNDLQKISLSAVSADGLYFSTDVSVICIQKSKRKPICLADFPAHFPGFDDDVVDDELVLNHIYQLIKAHNRDMTRYEELFLDLYFGVLKMSHARAMPHEKSDHDKLATIIDEIGLSGSFQKIPRYLSTEDVWRALVPIPEMQLYVQDPLASVESYEPQNNFRVDFGFWDGERLTAVEIDGAEPEGHARDVRRDRMLRRAGVDVIHILNFELAKHKARALAELLPAKFFGHGWDFPGITPALWGWPF